MIETSERASRHSRARWSACRGFGLQAILLPAALVIAISVRRAVASEQLDDRWAVGLSIGSVVALVLFAALAALPVLRARSVRLRFASAVAPLVLAAAALLLGRALYPATSVEMQSLESRANTDADTVIVLGPGGRDVRLSGEIVEGAAARLQALLDAHPEVERIALTSEGGLADEGQAIGDVVAVHDIDTYVPDFCVSACTLVFVRGKQRFAMNGARIGFHGPFEEGLFGRTFADDATAAKAAYVEAGVQSSFVDEALKVGPDDMWFPSPARLLSAHVATAFVGPDRFPDSDLDGSDTLDGSRAQVLTAFPILKAVVTKSPSAIDRIANWYLTSYRSGASESENTRRLHAIVRSAVAVAIAHADGDTALAILRYLDDALVRTQSPEACRTIGERADLSEAAGQLRGARSDAETAASALIIRAIEAGRTAPFSAAKPFVHATDAGECATVRKTYAAVLAQPHAAAATAARTLLVTRAALALADMKTAMAP